MGFFKCARLLTVTAGVVALTACGGSTASDDELTAQAKGRFDGKSTLDASFITYPPSMIVDANTGDYSGVMYEVAEMIAEKLDLELEVGEETNWGNMVQHVDGGRAEFIISGIWPSAARAKSASFSDAVYYSPVYAYVRADDTRFDGDLSAANDPSVTVATLDGELSAIVAASDFPDANTESLPSGQGVSQLMLQLTSNKADITFVEPAIANAYAAQNPDTIKQVGGVDPVRVFPNTFLMRKGDAGLPRPSMFPLLS